MKFKLLIFLILFLESRHVIAMQIDKTNSNNEVSQDTKIIAIPHANVIDVIKKQREVISTSKKLHNEYVKLVMPENTSKYLIATFAYTNDELVTLKFKDLYWIIEDQHKWIGEFKEFFFELETNSLLSLLGNEHKNDNKKIKLLELFGKYNKLFPDLLSALKRSFYLLETKNDTSDF